MAKKEYLIAKFNMLDSLKNPDIFQQIKKAEIARKIGINIQVSDVVLKALIYQPFKIQHKKKKKEKKRNLSKGSSVKILKLGSSIPTKYKDYIISKFWENRKKEYFKNIEKKCAACNSIQDICLHHMLYANLGKEKDEHLIPLCKGCHEEYHSLNGVQGNMIDKTLQFVESKQFSVIVSHIA